MSALEVFTPAVDMDDLSWEPQTNHPTGKQGPVIYDGMFCYSLSIYGGWHGWSWKMIRRIGMNIGKSKTHTILMRRKMQTLQYPQNLFHILRIFRLSLPPFGRLNCCRINEHVYSWRPLNDSFSSEGLGKWPFAWVITAQKYKKGQKHQVLQRFLWDNDPKSKIAAPRVATQSFSALPG